MPIMRKMNLINVHFWTYLDKESHLKMPHLIAIGLDVIYPLEWWRCKVVFQDFILSQINLVVVGHTLYISSALFIHEWRTLSKAFYFILGINNVNKTR